MAESKLSGTALEGFSIREATSSPKPDLASLPVTFVLATNLSESELHEVEDILIAQGAPLTYDIKAANLVIGNISKERRAKFELKRGNVPFEDYEESSESVVPGSSDQLSSPIAVKRRKVKDGTPELVGHVITVNTGNNNTIGTVTDINPNDDNHASRSNTQLSLVNMSFVRKFPARI